MSEKKRLLQLIAQISATPDASSAPSVPEVLDDTKKRISEIRKDVKKGKAKIVANPPHGEKGNFVKVTVTLPPAVYELIAQEATRRKMKKQRDPLISAIIREAV